MHPSLLARLRHQMIRSRWQRWLFPVGCCVPYGLSLAWLVHIGQLWIVIVLLAPLLMGMVIAVITLWLAHKEFRS